jgi:uncharacterized protein YkwD
MIQWLKTHFIPHHENDYQPHFLRLHKVIGLLLLIAFLEGAYLCASLVFLPRSAQFAAVMTSVLVLETNDKRATENLSNLHVNETLVLAAQMKANDMAVKGYFAHNAPDGKDPWYWFQQAGYDFAAAGENLAVNFTDSTDVTNAWMASPLHRANIMSGNYTEIGIATAEGTFKGKPALFVVQEFGRPSFIAKRVLDASSSVPVLGPLAHGGGTPLLLGANVRANSPVQIETPFIESAQDTVAPASAVAGAEIQNLAARGETVPASTRPLHNISLAFSKIIASPRSTTSILFTTILVLVFFALALAIFIKIRIQHPHLIVNGLLIIVLLVSLTLLNFTLGISSGVV